MNRSRRPPAIDARRPKMPLNGAVGPARAKQAGDERVEKLVTGGYRGT